MYDSGCQNCSNWFRLKSDFNVSAQITMLQINMIPYPVSLIKLTRGQPALL